MTASVIVAVLLALAELTSAWILLILPGAVLAMIGFHRALMVALARPGTGAGTRTAACARACGCACACGCDGGSWFAWLAFLICLGLLLWQYSQKETYYDVASGTTEKFHSGAEKATKKIAILSIEGVIATGEGHVRHQIDRIKKDKDVVAVVIRVNSPGGTVTGSDYIYHHLKKLKEERKLPMVVSMGSIAASGARCASARKVTAGVLCTGAHVPLQFPLPIAISEIAGSALLKLTVTTPLSTAVPQSSTTCT